MSNSFFELSDRLRAVCDTVIDAVKVADVGCDHGYVAITLIKEGKAENALCLDVNKGPLEAAKENIIRAGLDEKIETRLSDGLKRVSIDDGVNAVIIAGMGGRLVSDILEAGKDIVKNVSQLILQPQSELFLVREKVRELGFFIKSEKFLKDMGKYYWIMDVRPEDDNAENACNANDEYGAKDGVIENSNIADSAELQGLYDRYSEFLIKSKDELYKEYILESIKINEGYLSNVKDGSADSLVTKIEELKKVYQLMVTKG